MTFSRLFSRIDPQLTHLDDVVRYGRARLGSQEDAEDLAMEVYEALAVRPALLAGRTDPRLYILGMARRKIADRLRRLYRVAPPLDEPAKADPFDTWGVLWSLPEEHREVLCLRFMLGLSAQEVGEIMDRTPAAIDSLVQRAKAAFRAASDDITEEDQPCLITSKKA
jgi:RNA polymerase sigma-70 factor (ECF subfamily)